MANEYDKFLFFDFFIREAQEFFDALQKAVAKNTSIDIFYVGTLDYVGSASFEDRWSDKIKCVDQDLSLRNECYGLIISESKGSWILVQDIPVNWGVFAFKSRDDNALKLFHSNATSRDWFLSIDHFKQAIADPNSPMRESIDVEFMKTIVANYG